MMLSFLLVSMIGFSLSLYMYLIELKIKDTPSYKPVCDISDKISCSKPIKSKYSNLLFFSNAVIGMGFYGLLMILSFFDAINFIFFASLVACIASCFLAYILYFKINSLCLICTSLYVVNFTLLFMSMRLLGLI